MARGFRSGPDGLTARLSADERGLLGRLFQDIIGMLELPADGAASASADADPLEVLLGADDQVEAPSDPAVRRLLPDASADEERAREFRRFTDRSLREQKVASLRAAALAFESDPVRLSPSAAVDVSRALNDVRLVLSTRLGIDSEEEARRVEKAAGGRVKDTETYMAVVYSFVSWVQNSLIEAMLLDLPEDPAGSDGPDPQRS
ncbi:DUF2017 family protein [Kocuria palustris]|uniref:DUF2017 family protein n=1 Tax=Kocuria palustris TaxID=71999 RepID=UPI0011A760B7|nr:DUF2017 family protein [Kocuria palustris]